MAVPHYTHLIDAAEQLPGSRHAIVQPATSAASRLSRTMARDEPGAGLGPPAA